MEPYIIASSIQAMKSNSWDTKSNWGGSEIVRRSRIGGCFNPGYSMVSWIRKR